MRMRHSLHSTQAAGEVVSSKSLSKDPCFQKHEVVKPTPPRSQTLQSSYNYFTQQQPQLTKQMQSNYHLDFIITKIKEYIHPGRKHCASGACRLLRGNHYKVTEGSISNCSWKHLHQFNCPFSATGVKFTNSLMYPQTKHSHTATVSGQTVALL